MMRLPRRPLAGSGSRKETERGEGRTRQESRPPPALPGQVRRLIDYLKSLGTWWHCLDSTWLVVTDMSPKELAEKLKALLGPADELLVIDVTDNQWASYGFNAEGNDWLQRYTVSWRAA
jgi:hypothetical protein